MGEWMCRSYLCFVYEMNIFMFYHCSCYDTFYWCVGFSFEICVAVLNIL